MKKLILLVAIPASGKTSLALQLEKYGYRRFCADTIRGELYGDESILGSFEKVFTVFSERLEACLRDEDVDIVIDNTNIKAQDRGAIKELAKIYGKHTVETWLFDVPLVICQERNNKRSRRVPREVIDRFYDKLQARKDYIKKESSVIIGSKGLTEEEIKKYIGIV